MGGTKGLLRGLGTDGDFGLGSWQYADLSQQYDPEKGEGGGVGAGGDSPQSRASADDRRRIYGINERPSRNSKGLLLCMWLALRDKQLVNSTCTFYCYSVPFQLTRLGCQGFLSVAAAIEFVLGLYYGSGTPPDGTHSDNGENKNAGPLIGSWSCCVASKSLSTNVSLDWVEGAVIMGSISLIVIVSSFSDWQKERQFRRLNDKREDRGVKVIRDGKERVINIKVG